MIIANKLNGTVVLHVTSNSEYVVAGNSESSNLATGSEVVESVSVNKVAWGSANDSFWEVSQDGNTFLILPSVGEINLSGQGIPLPISANNEANLELNLNGDGPGFLLIELRKHAPIVETS